MTPLETIRRKKKPQADSCLPPADRLPSLVETPAMVEPSAALPRQTAQDGITEPIAPLAELNAKNVAPCERCGCPAHWLSRRGGLYCGGCRPPPFGALVDCWLLAVLVPVSPFGGGNEWRWEPFKPRFLDVKRRKVSSPT